MSTIFTLNIRSPTTKRDGLRHLERFKIRPSGFKKPFLSYFYGNWDVKHGLDAKPVCFESAINFQ